MTTFDRASDRQCPRVTISWPNAPDRFYRARALTFVCECRDIKREAHMTPRMPEHVFTLLSFVLNTVPPRDPNDGDNEEDDEDDEANDREPAVIREPDEDE